MGNFGLALVIILGGWWLLRALAGSQPAKVRGLVRKIMGWAIIAGAGFLMLRGATNVAIPLFILGAGMIGESALFPDGLQWPGSKPGPGPAASPAGHGKP